jgi:hypothetical protein
MRIAGSVALVTGANRGVGRAYVGVLLAMGARKSTPPHATSRPWKTSSRPILARSKRSGST